MLIKINDVAIEEPMAVEVGISDICSSVGSGVSQLGESFRDKIAVKRSVSCNWPPLDGERMSALLLAMEESCFELEYPDPQTAQMNSGMFYVSDRSVPMLRAYDNEWLWQGLAVTFEEK